MPNTIQNDTLQNILNKYERIILDSSYHHDHFTIKQLRKRLKELPPSTNEVDAGIFFDILLAHSWYVWYDEEEDEGEAIRAENKCVATILVKIFNSDFDIEQNFPVELLRSIKIAARFSLLNDLENAQANLTTISKGGRQYGHNIAIALKHLMEYGLLTGEHAQANRDDITKDGGQFAGNIPYALETLKKDGLLTGEHAQANLDAITKGGGQFAANIAIALKHLMEDGLLTGEYAQANRDAITKDGGQFAEHIAYALYRLQEASLLTGEHAQANLDAITKGGGQFAENIVSALYALNETDLLTGEHAQANRDAITKDGGQFAENIAYALETLNDTGLLTGEHAQANRDAITKDGGQYTENIVNALHALMKEGLLTAEHAQANLTAITQGGGQYAENIAYALDSLQRAGLLRGEHAQANRDAITQGGGQYAENIAVALDRLQRTGLLREENAQKNVELLFRYVRLSENNYGIKFAAKCMKDLTQERFSLLMLDESVSIGKEQLAFFSEIFSFVVPEEEDIKDEKFDYWALVKPMMRLHEYIHTYFSDEEQPEVLGYFIDMLESSYFAMDCSTELFSKLCQNFYHQGNHSSILFDENNLIKQMMLAILEMLAKCRNPEASFSTEVCEKINKELCPAKQFSTTDIGSPSAEETKTEESEHQVTEPLEEEFPVNERIVTLLYLSICQSPETFQTACAILKNLSVPPQLTRFSAAFNNASLFQKSKKPVSNVGHQSASNFAP